MKIYKFAGLQELFAHRPPEVQTQPSGLAPPRKKDLKAGQGALPPLWKLNRHSPNFSTNFAHRLRANTSFQLSIPGRDGCYAKCAFIDSRTTMRGVCIHSLSARCAAITF